MRIVWYLARDHDIKISGAGASRILTRNGRDRLPRGTRLRKVHTTRYRQQFPGHQIQVDVFLIFRGKDGRPIKRYQYTAIDDATFRLIRWQSSRLDRDGLTAILAGV